MKQIHHILAGLLLLVMATACEKDTDAEIFAPKVTTGTATDIYRKGATLSGSIALTETSIVDRYGILFSNLQSMAEYKELNVTSGESDFSMSIQDLEPGETYYFCSYAHSGYSIVRGEVRSFTTSQSNAPIFDTPVISETGESFFTVSSTLLDEGGSEIMLSGFCYNEAGEDEPTFMDNVVNVETSGNSISAIINGLQPGKTYQIRAYGASGNGLAYSGMITVTTGEAVIPFLSLEVKSHEDNACNVDVIVKLLEEGSSPITDLGVYYSINNPVPTIEDESFILEKGANEYRFSLNDLIPNITYYFRAYATNEYGTGYSDVVVLEIPENNSREKELLLNLYESTNGDNWFVNTNWKSNKPLNEWYGITTDDEGNILSIELPNNNLTGYANIHFDDFPYLTNLNFDNNIIEKIDIHTNGKMETLSLNNVSTGYINVWNVKNLEISCDSLISLGGSCEYLKVSNCDFNENPTPFSSMQAKDAFILNCKMHSCGLSSETLTFESSSTNDTWHCVTSKKLTISNSYCSTICYWDMEDGCEVNVTNTTFWRTDWQEEQVLTVSFSCIMGGDNAVWNSIFHPTVNNNSSDINNLPTQDWD